MRHLIIAIAMCTAGNSLALGFSEVLPGSFRGENEGLKRPATESRTSLNSGGLSAFSRQFLADRRVAGIDSNQTMIDRYDASTGQDPEDLLTPLLENLKISFLAPLQARGITVTNEQRAIFIGYILNRQSKYAGEFETDRLLLKKLEQQVRSFVNGISPELDLWPIVSDAMAGRKKQEVDTLLGGSPYVKPIFRSLGEVLRYPADLKFESQKYDYYPKKDLINETARKFFAALGEKRFSDITPLVAGRYFKEWREILEAMKTDPRLRKEMESFDKNMERKLLSAGLTDTEPPVVRQIWGVSNAEGKWSDYELQMILDASTWRVVRFERQ